MVDRKYDWVNDEDVRQELAAETVIIMFNDRDLKSMRFEVYANHRKNDVELYCKADQEQLKTYQKCLKAAVEGAHKRRFGVKMVVGPGESLEDIYDLVLKTYCNIKQSGRSEEVLFKKKAK